VKPLLRAILSAFLFVVCACGLALAGGPDSHGNDFRGHEFKGVVNAIESHYGVHHMRIPFLGLAVSLGGRAEGVSGMKLAVFEDFHSASAGMSSSRAGMTDDLRTVVEHSLGPNWQLFVRTRNQDDSDDTLIYVNLDDGKLQMMIVAIEPDEATVIQMNLTERALKKWIDEPGESADQQSGHHRRLAED
jgi:hypothetical protein